MLANHQKAVLQFSGGKDSTALLYVSRPYLDKIEVLFCDTGASFPHVLEFVKKTCATLGAHLTIAKPDTEIKKHIEESGFPSDIVPVDASPQMRPYIRQDVPLQSYFDCCHKMLWEPMNRYVRDSGATLVLRGSKKSDKRVGVPPGHFENGIEYASPLWNWTDNKVHAYLKQEGVELPDHYASVNDSLDCWLCTAHLAHNGKPKLDYLKSHYPQLWQETSERISKVKQTIDAHMRELDSCYAMVS